ncbi:MAG: NUDIX hydrolase [Bacteriovoracaceae bacterium]
MENEVYKGKFLRVTEELMDNIVWERVYLPPGVIIYPITPEGKIIYIKELRPHETPNTRIKPVSGIYEPDKGSPSENALRELQEEIGFAADHLENFLTIKTTGTTNSDQYFFLATGLRPSKLPNPDGEDIIMETIEFSPEELLEKYLNDEIRWSMSTLGFFRLNELLKTRKAK